MNFLTVSNINDEIQALDTLGIEPINALLSTIDELPISEEAKQSYLIGKAIIRVSTPSELTVFGTNLDTISNDKGDFYFLEKINSLGITNGKDTLYIGLDNKDKLIIQGDVINTDTLLSYPPLKRNTI